MSRLRNVLLPVASAAATAAAIVAVMSPAQPPPAAPAAEPDLRRPRLVTAPTAHRPPPIAGDRETAERVTALEHRLADLAPQQTDAPEDLDPDTARAEALARWQSTLAAHDAEPVDDAWAADVTPRYARDLYDLSQSADASFDVLDTACKTTTCSALLEFSDYGTATEEFSQLLYYDYEQNCSKEILLPEPADPAARYRATVLFDCGG